MEMLIRSHFKHLYKEQGRMRRMRKVVLYIAMSIDGFIADKTGGVSWIAGDGSDRENMDSYLKFFETIDTVIMGYRTYHQIVTELSPDHWGYEGKKTYVFTHKKLPNSDEIIFTDISVIELIHELKQQEGMNIWLCGGASIVKQMMDNNLVDQYYITIVPTLLGEGIRLFPSQDIEQQLKLISTSNYNGMIDICYEKRRVIDD